MLRFALSRIVMAVPTLLIVAVAVFVMIRLIPGDPAPNCCWATWRRRAALADLRARLGLDQTWAAQFGIWFDNNAAWRPGLVHQYRPARAAAGLGPLPHQRPRGAGGGAVRRAGGRAGRHDRGLEAEQGART